MNFTEKKRSDRCRRGAVTVETALILPVILFVLIVQIKICQLVCAQSVLDNAVMETAEIMSDYAVLYHEYGIAQLENAAISEIGVSLSGTALGNLGSGLVMKIIDLRGCAETGDNYLYQAAAAEICKVILSEDPLVKCGFIKYENLSFSGSRFFDDSENIELHAAFKVFGRVNVGTNICVRAWIRGDNPIGSITASESVWKLNNFARGKIIRSLFGANLPYDYPTIASFSSGRATMIKSLDHTKKTYQSGTELEKEVKSMIDKLRDFSGTEDTPGVDEEYIISSDKIKSKKLLLVMPTNELNEKQNEALLRIVTYAGSYGIEMEITLFQEAG